MLSDRSLYRISFVLTILGIISLYFLAVSSRPQEAEIAKVTGDFLGKTVSVSGSIKDKP